jgi:hypothetical protein
MAKHDNRPQTAAVKRAVCLFGWEKVPGGYIPISSDGEKETRHATSPQPLEYALATVKHLISRSIG